MAAVVDGAAGFWRVVDSTEVLPFGGAHFGAGLLRAWWTVREQRDDYGVHFLREEAAELVQPQRLVYILRRRRQLLCNFSIHRRDGVGTNGMCKEVVQSFEMLC